MVLVTPYLVQPFADKSQAVPMISEGELGDLPPPPPPAGLLPSGKEKLKTLRSIQKSEGAAGVVEPQPAIAEAATPKPLNPNSPLSKAFSKNLSRIYGDKMGDISKEKQSYGYMLE